MDAAQRSAVDTEKPETWIRMGGEALREIGILYLVFGILDAQIERRRVPVESLDIPWFAGVSTASIVLWLAGGFIERARKE